MNTKQLLLERFNKILKIIREEDNDIKLLSDNNGVNAFQIKNPYINVRVSSINLLQSNNITSLNALEDF